jgi:hypothetical protein
VPLEELAPSTDVPLLEWLEKDSDDKQFTLVQSKEKKKKTSQLLLENSVRTTPIRRSKRTTPSVYRRKGGQEGCAPLIKKLVGSDVSNKRIFLKL